MKKLAVLGHPIGHTLSPVMHNASIEALGLADDSKRRLSKGWKNSM